MVMCMDTDAREQARAYYSAGGRSLHADLAALAQNPQGLIYWTPQLVVLAKPVSSERPICCNGLAESPEHADGWYVHLLAGDLQWARRLARHLPPLGRLYFQRGVRSAKVHSLSWRRLLPH